MNIALTIATGAASWGQLALNWALSIKANDPEQKLLLIYTPSAIAGIEPLIHQHFDYTYNFEEHGLIEMDVAAIPEMELSEVAAGPLFCQQLKATDKVVPPLFSKERGLGGEFSKGASSPAPRPSSPQHAPHAVAFHIKTLLYDIVHSIKLKYNRPRKGAVSSVPPLGGGGGHSFIYMDADTILLPGRRLADWFKVHNVSGIRKRLATDNSQQATPIFTAYCNDVYNYETGLRHRKDYTFWCDPLKAKEYWQERLNSSPSIFKERGLGGEFSSDEHSEAGVVSSDNPQPTTNNQQPATFSSLPQINTSFLFFNTHPNVQQVFEVAKEVWNDTGFEYQAYKGAKPDELCFNIACAATGTLPHQVPFRPIFMQCFSESWSHEYIQHNYNAFGFAGTEQNPQHLIDWYNQLSLHYRNYHGVAFPFALQGYNRIVQDPAPIHIAPLSRHTIARRGDLPNSNGGAFNPDAIFSETHGGIITILRKEANMDAYKRKYTDHTGYAHLITPAHPEGIQLIPEGFPEGVRIEDFRLVAEDLINLKVVSELKKEERDMKTVLAGIANDRLIYLGSPALPVDLRKTDINWLFFLEGDRMYCIYQLSPFTIFYIEDNHWHPFTPLATSQSPLADWFHTGQYICNSTNPILIPGALVQKALNNSPSMFIERGPGGEYGVQPDNRQPTTDNYYLVFFHTKESKIYYHGAALMNARTKCIDYYTRNSITIKHPSEAEGLHPGLVYVSGALLLESPLERGERDSARGVSDIIKDYEETGALWFDAPQAGPPVLRVYFGEGDSHAAYHEYDAQEFITAIITNHNEHVAEGPAFPATDNQQLTTFFQPLNISDMDINKLANRLTNTNHPGWCSAEKMAELHALVHVTNQEFDGDILSVEAGVFGGRSLYPLALAHKETGNGHAFGIDTWDNTAPLEGTNDTTNDEWWANVNMDEVYNKFMQGVANFELRGFCRWLQGRTDVAVRLFHDNSITLFHQDGNHSEEVTVKEVELWAPKIRNGGYWVVDDMNWPTTQTAYQKTLPANGFVLQKSFGDWAIYRKEIATN